MKGPIENEMTYNIVSGWDGGCFKKPKPCELSIDFYRRISTAFSAPLMFRKWGFLQVKRVIFESPNRLIFWSRFLFRYTLNYIKNKSTLF